MSKIKDFQLLVYSARRIDSFSTYDKFNFDKISDYLMLDIYDINTIREYIQMCNDVSSLGGVPIDIDIKSFPRMRSGSNTHMIHNKKNDLLFLKNCLILEYRNRILNELIFR